MATCVLQGRMPESASENARAVAGRADRDAVSIDAVNGDHGRRRLGGRRRPDIAAERRRRIRPATSSTPPLANGCAPATISCTPAPDRAGRGPRPRRVDDTRTSRGGTFGREGTPGIDSQSDSLRSGNRRDCWKSPEAKIGDFLSKTADPDLDGYCWKGLNRTENHGVASSIRGGARGASRFLTRTLAGEVSNRPYPTETTLVTP